MRRLGVALFVLGIVIQVAAFLAAQADNIPFAQLSHLLTSPRETGLRLLRGQRLWGPATRALTRSRASS